MTIEVVLTHQETGTVLGKITIENVSGDDTHADYSVKFAADRLGAIGLQRRAVYAFPRTKYNVLALLLQALNTLEPPELELEDGVSSSNLANSFRNRGSLALRPHRRRGFRGSDAPEE